MGKKKKGGGVRKGKKKRKNKVPSKKYSKYKVVGDKLERKAYCPKCGPGVFLAEHKGRKYCGCCGYTVFDKKEAPKKEEVFKKKE